ncbi:MAG TPA: ATP-dependent DNA ligase [Terriglobales bacterium]|nr:ATP-dependent DNA ligase [Terriglobales bacterium]
MHRLAQVAEAIAATTKKSEKVRLLADYFRERTVEEAAASAIFLSGRAFPAFEEITLQVGGTILWSVLREISHHSDEEMTQAYRKYGDLGSAAYDLLQGSAPKLGSVNVVDLAREFRRIAGTRGAAAKASFVRLLFAKLTPLEAKYVVKIMSGDLRIGLRESLVEEAIAVAYGDPLAEVQKANMLLGDIGETLKLAAARRLADARMRLFHPIGFMLASPAESAEEAFSYFDHAQVEDKYDGIRAQAHVSNGEVRIYSRTLDEITDSFPELPDALCAFTGELIMDGEIVAWHRPEGSTDIGRALPFTEIQKRLGRKKVTPSLMREVPVAYVVFDVLFADGELVIERPLADRGALLEAIFARAVQFPNTRRAVRTRAPQGQLAFKPLVETSSMAQVLRAPVVRSESTEELAQIFEQALERGNEGLMIKDVRSPYSPGRRGKSWLKLKRELATLDVVVTAVEFGHGKRASVLSDYTFAVRASDTDDSLLNVGKAYSGLTDVEIAQMTDWFKAHTIEDEGWRRTVEPQIVIEVAFNAVMISDRHNSGYALRFPRIVRLRPDKTTDQVDTLERVREIFERQKKSYPSRDAV